MVVGGILGWDEVTDWTTTAGEGGLNYSSNSRDALECEYNSHPERKTISIKISMCTLSEMVRKLEL